MFPAVRPAHDAKMLSKFLNTPSINFLLEWDLSGGVQHIITVRIARSGVDDVHRKVPQSGKV